MSLKTDNKNGEVNHTEGEFNDELYSSVKNYCYALAGNKWDGEDLAQESFYKALKHYDKDHNKALLRKIAHNGWMDTLRKRKHESLTEAMEIQEETEKNKYESILEMTEELVSKLTPKQVITLVLKDGFQYRNSEIAKELGMTETGVKSLILRARTRIGHSTYDSNDTQQFWRSMNQEEFMNAISKTLREEDPKELLKIVPLLTIPSDLKKDGQIQCHLSSHSYDNLSLAA